MFADYELQAHRLVEDGRPVTAEGLGEIYFNLLQAYYGDALDYDELSRVTWARIPHFYSTPYYVYQYATCFASSAQLMKHLTSGSEADRAAAIDRYLTLLKSGGSDHPMTLLQRAGRRSQQAGNRPRRRRSARPARDAARTRDQRARLTFGSIIGNRYLESIGIVGNRQSITRLPDTSTRSVCQRASSSAHAAGCASRRCTCPSRRSAHPWPRAPRRLRW